MDDMDFFDNIDLKEVSKRTLIDIKELGYLKDEEFDKLSKSKGLGFLKIIEREYKVDLSDKKEKFLEYLKEHKKDSNNEFFIAPPKTTSNVFPKIVAALLMLLIIIGAMYILYLNSSNNSSVIEAEADKNPIIQEAKKISGIDINETTANEIKNEDNESASIADKNTTILKSEEIMSQNLSSTSKEANLSLADFSVEKLSQVSKNDANNKEENITNTQVLTIVPKKRIWVGVVDLSNYKKSSYIRDNNITISKNSSFLIATGHGKFDIYYKDQILKFDTINSVKLLVKDGKIIKIDKKEFIKLNRGKYW